MIIFSANTRRATALSDDVITTRSVGIPVSLVLSSEFDGLAKTFCARNGTAAVDVVLVGDEVNTTLPADVLLTPGQLQIGVYAADESGNIVIPTVWALVGQIKPGATPAGVDPSTPTPSWPAQVQQIAAQAMENSEQAISTANEAKEAAITAQDSASASAEAAAGSADAAAGSATDAAQSASDAAESETNASGSAAEATTKAGEAASSATAAYGAASAAETAAQSVSASAAQIQQNTEDITDLKSAIDGCVKLVPGTNILNAYDTDRTLTNKYVSATTGRVTSNSGWLSFLFPVNGGGAISCRQVKNAHLSFYAEDTPNFASLAAGTILNGYISGFSPTTTVENYEVPIAAKYMCVSIPESRQDAVMVAYSTTVPPYEPYKEGIHYNLILDPPEIPGAVETVEYNVYADGTGDYENLRQAILAINAAGDASATKIYVLKLYPGTHDVISMYDSESALPTNGLFIPAYTKLVGMGDKHNIIISGERATTSTTWSVFNIRDYADIENVTIKSKNARYTIHDDWQTEVDVESYRHFKDVIFIGENCQYGSVYGAGLKGNSDWEFINCEFDASKSAANGTPGNTFSLHNNNNVTTPSFVKFRNCRHINGSESYKTFRLLSMTTGSENGTVTVTLEGNKIDGIRLSENNASQYGAGCSFWVTGFGNVNPLGVSVVSTDGIDYSGRVDLI